MKNRLFLGPLAVLLSASLVAGQTKVTAPTNKYTPAQDVELGREAAAEARKTLPIMRDDAVTSYVEDIGKRLVSAIPSDLEHPEFRYTFETVNVSEINAFALPGGPMFVHRGMIEAAKTEAEVAGVMSHEIMHVLLRHGTAQASKATKYQVGSVIGAIAGAVIGGGLGSVVAQGTQFGLGTAFMRYGREYERQADIGGAQLMARAGYDPREMANMFKTIEKEGKSSGPEWLSDHPNPGNRVEYITKEARLLKIENQNDDERAFERVRAHLKSLPPAPTSEEASRTASRGGSSGGGNRPIGRVDPPSGRYVTYQARDLFQINVPENWRERQGNNSVTFAPDGALGDANGQSGFTHGVELGLAESTARDLRTATDDLIDSLGRGNPRLTRAGNYRRATLDSRQALQINLRNVSDLTGQTEIIQLVTVATPADDLFYAIAVVPENEVRVYQPAFQKVIGSLRFAR